MEILFVMVCTALAFMLFFLAFLVKSAFAGRSGGATAPRPTCGRCRCHQTDPGPAETLPTAESCPDKRLRLQRTVTPSSERTR